MHQPSHMEKGRVPSLGELKLVPTSTKKSSSVLSIKGLLKKHKDTSGEAPTLTGIKVS